MPTNSVSMADHLAAMSSAAARDGLRPECDAAGLRTILSSCTPTHARDAFLQFTASNQPEPERTGPAPSSKGLWGWSRTHPWLAAVLAFFAWVFTTGVTSNAGVGFLVLAGIVGVIVAIQSRGPRPPRATKPTASNPWPFAAERTPAHGELAGESTVLRPEAELTGIAVQLVTTIKASPVMRTDVLDVGSLVAQLDQALASISQHCYRIWWLRSTIEYPESDSDVGRALKATIDQRIARVQENWRALLDNVAQLAELATNFDSYAKILRDYERHRRMLAAGDGLSPPIMPDPQWAYLHGMQANLSAQVGFINDTARHVSSVEFG